MTEIKQNNRITRRLNNNIIEFVDGKGYGNLSHSEGVKLLFERLSAYEDTLLSPAEISSLLTTIESQKEEINRLMGVNQHLEIDLSESKAITELAVKGLEHYAEWIDWEDDSMGDKARSTLSEIEVLSQ